MKRTLEDFNRRKRELIEICKREYINQLVSEAWTDPDKYGWQENKLVLGMKKREK